MMRILSIVALVIAAVSFNAGTTRAAEGPWCANVDIGTEFTQLISAQRGYEVNAKAFSIANQMMQDAVDLLH